MNRLGLNSLIIIGLTQRRRNEDYRVFKVIPAKVMDDQDIFMNLMQSSKVSILSGAGFSNWRVMLMPNSMII